MIIAIHGYKQSGKDTVGEIIQKLILTNEGILYEKKQFSEKLKQVLAILLGVPRSYFESEEFKNKELDKEWWIYKVFYKYGKTSYVPYNDGKIGVDPNDYEGHQLIKTTPRFLLKYIGTDLFRNQLNPYIWINSLLKDYEIVRKIKPQEVYTLDGYYVKCKTCGKTFVSKNKRAWICNSCLEKLNEIYPDWIITDLRFHNEIDIISEKEPKALFLKIKGRGIKGKHESEQGIEDKHFDYILDNSGTKEELVKQVRKILTQEKLI